MIPESRRLSETVSLEPEQLPTEAKLALTPADVNRVQQNPFDQRDQLVTSQVDASTTFALDQFGHYGTTAEDIILTRLLLAYTDVFDCTNIPLQYTSHGWNALGNPWDISHTVGFFVNVCPIVLRRKGRSNLATTLDGVQSTLRGVSDFAARYMLGGHTMKSPIAYNFLGKPATVDSGGANGIEAIDIFVSGEFQRQRVNIEAISLIIFVKYTGDCLTLTISYEPSRYSIKCMSKVLEMWENGIRCITQWLKSQE
ncbi:hypothetical protein IWQ61_003553 [Dispira simplex]|nr:hypothetical protein IWQ61_003553 [Dispira simplex]